MILRFDSGRGLEFTDVERQLISRDHVNFLRNLRSCPVEEQLIVDFRGEQTTYVKYLLEFDRRVEVMHEEAFARFDQTAIDIAELVDGGFGLRLMLVNRVIAEAETVARTEPGQVLTGRMLHETTKIGYIELYWDQRE